MSDHWREEEQRRQAIEQQRRASERAAEAAEQQRRAAEVAPEEKMKDWRYWWDPVCGFWARMKQQDEYNEPLSQREEQLEMIRRRDERCAALNLDWARRLGSI